MQWWVKAPPTANVIAALRSDQPPGDPKQHEVADEVCDDVLADLTPCHEFDISLSNGDSPAMPDNRSKASWINCYPQKPCVYLVRAPLTFGHSQLLVPRNGFGEAESFKVAADFIARGIGTFERAFGSKKVRTTRWRTLAEYTLTDGKYLKTIVLRVSADEDKTMMKFHLVPYFESHARLCLDRFHRRTRFQTKKPGAADPSKLSDLRPGGLIGWLGDREDFTQVLEDDFEARDREPQAPYAKWAASAFGLERLASRLRPLVPPWVKAPR
jgi:hypothetical protein